MPSQYTATYQDYLRANRSAPDDAGNTNESSLLSEEAFNKLPEAERWRISQVGGAMASNDYLLDANDPYVQQFLQRFGATPEQIANNRFQLNNEDQGGYRIGYANDNGVAGPQYGRADWNQLAIDPSRILWIDPEGTPNRRYIFEGNNRRGDVVVGEQAREADSGLGDNAGLIMASLVLGGGLGANLLGAEAIPGVVGDAEQLLASQVAGGGGVSGTPLASGVSATTADLLGSGMPDAAQELAANAAANFNGPPTWEQILAEQGYGGLDPETALQLGGPTGASAPNGFDLYLQNFLDDPTGSLSRWASNGTLTDSLTNAGSNFINRLPAVAGALRGAIPIGGKPQGGGGLPGGGGGSGGFGGSGGGVSGFTKAGGGGLDAFEAEKMKRVLSLAEYLGSLK